MGEAVGGTRHERFEGVAGVHRKALGGRHPHPVDGGQAVVHGEDRGGRSVVGFGVGADGAVGVHLDHEIQIGSAGIGQRAADEGQVAHLDALADHGAGHPENEGPIVEPHRSGAVERGQPHRLGDLLPEHLGTGCPQDLSVIHLLERLPTCCGVHNDVHTCGKRRHRRDGRPGRCSRLRISTPIGPASLDGSSTVAPVLSSRTGPFSALGHRRDHGTRGARLLPSPTTLYPGATPGGAGCRADRHLWSPVHTRWPATCFPHDAGRTNQPGARRPRGPGGTS